MGDEEPLDSEQPPPKPQLPPEAAAPATHALPLIDPAKIFEELRLWDGVGNSTKLALFLEQRADRLFKKRGLRTEGIEAYQDMLCWILENKKNCLARRAQYPTNVVWLVWLISKCVDQYRRSASREVLTEIQTDDLLIESVNLDDIEKEVEAEDRREKLRVAINGRQEFLELLDVIHLRDDHQALADALGMDIPQVRRLLARFTYFVKKIQELGHGN